MYKKTISCSTWKTSKSDKLKSVKHIHQWSCCQPAQWPMVQWTGVARECCQVLLALQDAGRELLLDAAAHADVGTYKSTLILCYWWSHKSLMLRIHSILQANSILHCCINNNAVRTRWKMQTDDKHSLTVSRCTCCQLTDEKNISVLNQN